jgi:hypothetical protein
MRVVYGGSESGTSRVDGQRLRPLARIPEAESNQCERPDRIVRPVTRINGDRIRFRDLAFMAWPKKTEANLAFVTGYDPRTCRRWLADDTEPPAEALSAVLVEIMRRYSQRD